MVSVYLRAEGGSGLLTIATTTDGVGFSVAADERKVVSVVVPWAEYWELLRNMNACEKAFFAAAQEGGEDE